MEKRKPSGFACFLLAVVFLWIGGGSAGEPEPPNSNRIIGGAAGKIVGASHKEAGIEIMAEKLEFAQQIYDEVEAGDWTNVYMSNLSKGQEACLKRYSNGSWERLDVTGDGIPELISVYDYPSWKEKNAKKKINFILSNHQGRMEPVFITKKETGKEYVLGKNGRITYQVQSESQSNLYSCLSFTACELGEVGMIKNKGKLTAIVFYEDMLYSEEERVQLAEGYPDTYGKSGSGLYCFWSEEGEDTIGEAKERIGEEEFLRRYHKMIGENFFRYYPGWANVFGDEPWYFFLDVPKGYEYVPAYARLIRNRQVDMNVEETVCGIIYAGGDDIPELAIGEGSLLELYTYIEGQGVKQVDMKEELLQAGEFISMALQRSPDEVLGELYEPILEEAGLDAGIYGLEKRQERYLLTSGRQIETLSELIAAGGEVEPGIKASEAHYLLCRNLEVKDWISLGSRKSPFKGMILGNGYTIEGVNFSIQTDDSLEKQVKELTILDRRYLDTEKNAAGREEIETCFGEEGKAVLRKLLDEEGGRLGLVNLQRLEEGIDSCIFSLEGEEKIHVFISGFRGERKLSFQHFTLTSQSFYPNYHMTVADINEDEQEDLLIFEGSTSGTGGQFIDIHGLVWNEKLKQYEKLSSLPSRIAHVELNEKRLISVWRLGFAKEGIDVYRIEKGEYVLAQHLVLTIEPVAVNGRMEYIPRLSYYEGGKLIRMYKLPDGEDTYDVVGNLYPELDYWRRG